MSKKTFLVLVGFAFLFSFNLARADVVINEVQYSPTTKQWIEIYNNTDEDIDITTYKILDSGAQVNGHGISVVDGGSNFIPKHSFGIVTKVPDNFNSASFSLFKSSLNIKVSEDNVILKNNLGENISSVDVDGSAIDGNSLQLVNGSWVVATPTPGAENQTSEDDNNDDNTDNTNTTTNSSGSSKKTETKEPEIPLVNKTKITAQMPAFVGLPVQFKASNTVSDKSCGKYSLNFGDGNSLETEKTFPIPEKFSHIYYYPGEYIVTLECYESYLSAEPDSSDKIIVKVISSEVVISKIGDAKDFFIEISNNAPFEANISGWVLISYQNKFVFPKNTIIKSKNKIIVSPKTTNFSILDKETLKLIDSEGETVLDYSFTKPIRISAKNSAPLKVSMTKDYNLSENNTNINVPASTGVSLGGPVDNLLAGAIKSDVNTGNNVKYGIFGLFALLGVGTSTAYFIRNRDRKSISEAIGNDFKIIDE